MYLLQFLRLGAPTNRNTEADRYTPTHNLPGRDSEYSLTGSDALGVARTSQGATPKYSKPPSRNQFTPHFSFT